MYWAMKNFSGSFTKSKMESESEMRKLDQVILSRLPTMIGKMLDFTLKMMREDFSAKLDGPITI
jgi:hypothetical protein